MNTIDLAKWTIERYDPAQIGADKYKQEVAEWEIASDGLSVSQTKNASPSFFYSDFNSLKKSISVKVEVETNYDNDFIGFALNFQPKDTKNTNAEFLLLTWSAQLKRPGLKLCRVKGIPHFLDFLKLPVVATANTLGTTAWEHHKPYHFKFEFNNDKVQIWVDEQLEFEINDEFSDGHFALFDCSEQEVFFSEIQLLQRHEGKTVTFAGDNFSANPKQVTVNGITLTTSTVGGTIKFSPYTQYKGLWLGAGSTKASNYTLQLSQMIDSIEIQFSALDRGETLTNFVTNNGAVSIQYTNQSNTAFNGTTISCTTGYGEGRIKYSGSRFNSFSLHHSGGGNGVIIEQITIKTA